MTRAGPQEDPGQNVLLGLLPRPGTPRVWPMDCDLLLLGDGPIAHSLILALAETPLRVCVVDSTPAGREKSSGEEERTVALALASLRLLRAFDVCLPADASGPIRQVQISQARGLARVQLSHELLAAPEGVVGEVVVLDALRQGLQTRLPPESEQFRRLAWGPVESFAWYPDRVRLGWGQDRQIEAKLLILADGGHGRLQRMLSLQRRGWDHNRYACTARVGSLGNSAGIAYEHFLESGPLAFLPRADGRFSLVWSLLPSAASRLTAATDSEFLRQLNAQLPPGLAPLREVEGRGLYPLHFQQFTAPPSSRVLPLGNAAQTLHPLAGQGYNLGLRDAVTLAALLREAAGQASDPGAAALLQDFQRIRRQDRLETIAFTEGMNRLFALPPLPWRLGRDLALQAVESSPLLKRRLAARLAGIDLPFNSRIPDLELARHAR
jgi:2-octaprenyl-6-methoxyphenol hydroxylase